jgi:DNA (cytosine-5)-methyltransferase 1
MQVFDMAETAHARSWSFYEFFAGGGMARAGLGSDWVCRFANDFDPMKARTYRANWEAEHFVEGDVAKLSLGQLPDNPDLVWASFPCQDLSLAGNYRGLGDAGAGSLTRSGTFWPFWLLVQKLKADGRGPRLIVLENVPGTITSRSGKDFASICEALAEEGYRVGAMIVDAKYFVPQSRPRLFFVAVADGGRIPAGLSRAVPHDVWHPDALRSAVERLPASVRENWVLADLIEENPMGCAWHTSAETAKLLAMMSPLHLAKIEQARSSGRRLVGGVYKRTRPDGNGNKRQRAEIRFDNVAGCLRTPGGGSSRQTIMVVEGSSTRSRLLSPREAARLMGLPDDYVLPVRYNDAYHVAGDGVCVPVVRHLANCLLEPILKAQTCATRALAA